MKKLHVRLFVIEFSGIRKRTYSSTRITSYCERIVREKKEKPCYYESKRMLYAFIIIQKSLYIFVLCRLCVYTRLYKHPAVSCMRLPVN